MTAELKQYYKKLDKHLNCPKELRLNFREQSRRMVDDFIADHPDASFDEVKSFLGEPEELAQSFRETVASEALSTYKKGRFYVKLSGAIFFILVFLAALVFSIHMSRQARDAEITKEVTLIIYENGEE